MTYEERPRSLFGRLRSLIKGMFSIWLRDTERQNPRGDLGLSEEARPPCDRNRQR